jgi:predicted metal-dependent phosphoesterase TrpH
MTIEELAEWYVERGYQFIAIGEHSEDMSEEKVEILKRQSTGHSRDGFCIIPGIEYSCTAGIHIFGLGALRLTREANPVRVAEEIRTQGGIAILAHPYRYNWDCAPELLKAVNAVEIWNVAYDGKYLPSAQAPEALYGMRRINPELLAIAGQDLHGKAGFYDVAVQTEADYLTPEAIRSSLLRGDYLIKSRFFQITGRAHFSSLKSTFLRVGSWQLGNLRKARDFYRRWFT